MSFVLEGVSSAQEEKSDEQLRLNLSDVEDSGEALRRQAAFVRQITENLWAAHVEHYESCRARAVKRPEAERNRMLMQAYVSTGTPPEKFQDELRKVPMRQAEFAREMAERFHQVHIENLSNA